jgi:hypothetical protein
MFAMLVARSLPILLELGARAAKGHDPSQELARRALRTLAEAAGQPLTGPVEDGTTGDDSAVKAGLRVIETAFATVLAWAVGPDWPPDSTEE